MRIGWPVTNEKSTLSSLLKSHDLPAGNKPEITFTIIGHRVDTGIGHCFDSHAPENAASWIQVIQASIGPNPQCAISIADDCTRPIDGKADDRVACNADAAKVPSVNPDIAILARADGMDSWHINRLDFFSIESIESRKSTEPHESATVFTDFRYSGMRKTLLY